MDLSVMTLGESLLAAANEFGRTRFISLLRADGSFEEVDRLQFLDMALRVAGWCREHGLTPGDRALLCLENSPAWGAAWFGILLAGGVAVPVDAQSVPADAAYCLEKTRASLVFASDPSLFNQTLPEGCLLVHGLDEPLSHDPLPRGDIHRGSPGSLAELLFTSGTTGRPKAVMLTHANLLANVRSILDTGLVTPADNFLAVLPLHHAYPCMVNLLTPLYSGAGATYLETLKPEAILAALRTAGVSILVLTPQYVGVFYRRILKRFEDLPLGAGKLIVRLLTATAGRTPDPLAIVRKVVRRGLGPDFRFFLTGGARCEPEVITGMAALGVGVIEGYGLSETSPVVSFNPPGNVKPGSVGPPLSGVEVRIDRPDAEGYGEIFVRGANVMPGYFEDPEASAKALGGGWFHTGDQGRLDRDGTIFVRGRDRDVIVLPSGKKFSAEEVEVHYRQAPSVGDICILQDREGALRAVVTPNREFFRSADAPDVRRNIRWDLEVLSRSLPPYRRVSNVVVVSEDLPKTRLGKIKRHLVEKMLQEDLLPPADDGQAGDDWPGLSEAGLAVLEAVRRVSGARAVGPASHLELDLGLDSLKRLELMTLMEDVLGRPVAEERFQRLATAKEVIDLAEELASGTASVQETAVPGESPEEVSPAPGDKARQPDKITRAGKTGETGGAAFDLRAELSPELAAKVRLEFSRGLRLATHILGVLVGGAARLGFGLSVRGARNIPEGAAILCPNHASFLDGFMVLASVPMRQRLRLYFLGLARFFSSGWVKNLAPRFRLIPVDAGRMSETLRLSAYALRNGGLLCAFPEGARTANGELQEFMQGPVMLSRDMGIPVVPVAITGTYEAWPVGGSIRPHKVTVAFGKPIMPESADELRETVRALLNEAPLSSGNKLG